jgi:glycosyltransferase involved in cell wall biosynthesis
VVDDGSTDGGGDIVAEMQSHNSNIKLIRQQNAGVSSARNNALSVASGKYIYFVDADDFLIEDSMAVKLQYMDDNGVELLSSEIERIRSENLGDSKFEKTDFKVSEEVMTGTLFLERTNMLTSIEAVIPRFIIKRSLIRDNNISLVEGMVIAEDFIFNLHCVSRAKRVAVCENPSYVYVKYANSSCHCEVDVYTNIAYAERTIVEFNKFLDKYEQNIQIKDLASICKAVTDVTIYTRVLWPMVRDIVSPSDCVKAVHILRKKGLYPLNMPSKYPNLNCRDACRTVRYLWYATLFEPIWIMLNTANWLTRRLIGNKKRAQR